MADEKLNLVVTARDKASGALKRVKTQTSGLFSAMKSLKGLLVGGVGFVVLAAGLKKVLRLTGEQETAVTKLNTALRATGQFTPELSQSMQDLAGQLQKVSNFGDEVILSAEAMLLSLSGLDAKGVKKLLPGIIDMATAMGMDLTNAALIVAKSIGSSTNALIRYGIEMDTAGTKTEKADELLKSLNEKFGGAAQAQAELYSGEIIELSDSFGDLLQSMGAVLTKSDTFIGFIKNVRGEIEDITGMITDWNTANKENVTELELQQIKVNKLDRQLKANIATLDRYNKLYGENNIDSRILREEITRLTIKLEGERKILAFMEPVLSNVDVLKQKMGITSKNLTENIKEENEELKKNVEFNKALSDAVTDAFDAIELAHKEAEQTRIEIAEKQKQAFFDQKQYEQSLTELHTERLKEQYAADEEAFKESQAKKKKVLLESFAFAGKMSDATVGFIMEQSKAEEQAAIAKVINSEDSEAQIDSIRKRYARKQKNLKRWALLADTGLAIMRGYAQLGPVGGVANQIAVTALSLAQLAAINNQNFQTRRDEIRTVPGPPSQPVLITAHGGEQIGRGAGAPGGGGITIIVEGNIYDGEAGLEKIADGLRDYQDRTGVSI